MKSKKLKGLLNSGETLVVPDAYDPISAKLIENAGFKAVQCSGYSFSISAGYKREIDVNLDENIELTRRIVESVNVPVMADAEDGFGGPEEVIDTVAMFIETGAAGINIEDQIPDGKSKLSIIDADLMAQKIMVARETAEIEGYHDFVINGRTDALKSTDDRYDGLELAIDRANQYLEAGADLAFVTYAATLDEVKQITKEVKGPVSIAAGQLYNINNFTIRDLQKLGVARVSLPTLLIFSSLHAINNSLQYLKEDNLSEILEKNLLCSVEDLNNILK
ncbi:MULTISPECIES: isocitrate lyase/PEP mutase family protein [Methanobacterium]|uniref:2,3-dimethylmalate lyase n=1 Tax=Methanobacterium bryantii TaxID=2161 RepID=A0A2A2H719_METBR|nr:MULTISPECIES: isocitrate lyase/phosphoenolpyruvate mutase family protein [Methanobacterium]OEC85803.1 2,3-dimethylmalate lyase [Methanobacterium sp. A39]PAV05043.1 2,3-dimethylmalate lyase [Methanobacterium bryantii]